MTQTTLNISLDETLEQHGAEVLERENISTSEAVEALFQYMEEHQKFPEDLRDVLSRKDPFQEKRELMHSLVGILPPDISLEDARRERLAARGCLTPPAAR